MQFVDLKTQFERIEEDVMKRINTVLQSQRFVMGPEVTELEEALSSYVGVKHAVACSSGTDALVMPLMALNVKEGDAIFVPSFTFFATAESVSLVGAEPVFVDIDSESFNISPVDLEEKIKAILAEGRLRPRGIIPVDLFGRLADYEAIESIAKKYNLFILEDACQGFGASNDRGRAGSFGLVAATSFFPAKPLGCYGDGGAIFTDDDDLKELLVSIRVHGQGADKYDNVRMGINGRLDSLQAAVILSKMSVFDEELVTRAKVAQYYTAHLKNYFQTPRVPVSQVSAWAQYTLLAESEVQREKVLQGLKERSIPAAVYYPIPIHLSGAYAGDGYAAQQVQLPITEDYAKRVFSIPMHPYLNEQTMDRVIQALKESL